MKELIHETEFSIETERLKIVALDLNNLYHYIHDYSEVQKNLGVKVTMERQDPEMAYTFNQLYYYATCHPDQYYWYTSWEMILKSEQVIIGGLCFKGPPNEFGEVEIGYGVEPDFQYQHFATEGVCALVKWAIQEQTVKKIIAFVEPDNGASQHVLLNAGFVLSEDTYEGILQVWEMHVNRAETYIL